MEFRLRIFHRIEYYISALDRDGTFYFAEYRLLRGGLLILHHKVQVICSEQQAFPREFLEKVKTLSKQAKVVYLNLTTLAQVARVSTPSVKVTRTWNRLHVSHTWYRCAFPYSVLVWRVIRSPNDLI